MSWAKGYFAFSLLIGLAMPLPAASANPDIILLTLEWPPFTGSTLPDKGFVSKHLTQAYSAAHQTVHIGIFDWRQAIRLSYTDKRFAGSFPVYPTIERKKVCHLSDPIGVSELGLAQRKQSPVSWRKIEDLSRIRIGIVDGYANENTLDDAIRNGKINVVTAQNDTDNLLNLAQKKVDSVVIDTQVFKWLLKNDKKLASYRNQLQMNERLLVTWPLHVCFRKDAEGAKQRDILNNGLMLIKDYGQSTSLPIRQHIPSKPSITPEKA